MPKLAGKCKSLDTIDHGKGKGAEADEAGVVVFKVDGGGLKGKLILEHPMDHDELSQIHRGDPITVSIDFPQRKLDVNQRAVNQRAAAASVKH